MPFANLGPLPIVFVVSLILLLLFLSEAYIHPWINRALNKLLTKFSTQDKPEPKGYHRLEAKAREIERNTAAR
ncbi:hypothetical protein HGA34_05360 [Candidatus Falkowbacteria bacterium]|nr:hypothetical protein [Candidatus Falkowbacteria bacterium]